MWPRGELGSTKAFAWPYDEVRFHVYTDWQPIATIIKDRFREIERVQSEIFARLIVDLPKFERNIVATIT
jgi:hypothetical protein